MKLMKSFTIVAVAVSLAATPMLAQTGNATDDETTTQQVMIAPSIDLTAAAEIAMQNGQGTLLAVELDYVDVTPIYLVEMEGPKSHTMLAIDGTTGDVLASNVTSAQTAEIFEFIMSEFEEDGDDDEEDHEDADDDQDAEK